MTGEMLTQERRKVLITGCSDGSLGASLAIAFHKAGIHVYATARNPAKMAQVLSHGIEILTLDVLSESSINECVNKLSSLDILVNNAGALYSMPISDLSISNAKKLFDLNVWSHLAMTQAFLPLLLKSKGIIVNHTSSASVLTIPFQSTYNASKAAMAMFSDTMRLELAPFRIRVIELKTATVESNNFKNQEATHVGLPDGSIYEPAKEVVQRTMRGDYTTPKVTAEEWATSVVQDLLMRDPPAYIWKGTQAWLVRILAVLPQRILDGMMRKMTGVDIVQRMVRQ